LGATITQLRRFAQKADHDEPFEPDEVKNLKGNELGEISRHIVDIYQRLRQTRDDLFIEREKLIMHLQLSHEGLAIFKPDKDVILANSYFTQYSNLLSDSNLLRTEDVFNIPELQSLFQFINQTRQHYAQTEEKRKALIVDKNGRIFRVESIVFQDSTFEISINDITQQEEQARLKKQITQNVAHELKTPVSSIQGYIETILTTPNLPPDKMQLFLQRSYAQSNRLTNLLRDISALTRMDEASDMIEREEVDLTQMMHTIQQEVSLQLEEKGMKVVTSVPEVMPIHGNTSLLYSIFRNLMDNAIAYAGQGTTVSVSCFREDSQFYYFSFADNGGGVADEHLGRLFERFYRVDKGRSRKLGGTGLGLAIVKNAVLFHGGNINAKHALGGGLEFVFSLRK
jgi:signal transduction histidine kinase